MLLKNNKLLPLDIRKIRSISVVGPHAATCEFGDYSGTPVNQPVSILEGLKNKAGKSIKLNYIPWKFSKKRENQILSVKDVKRISESDYVIAVVGINKEIEREGNDKNSLNLPDDQSNFIREVFNYNPKTVVVLVTGSPLAINWISEKIPAIISEWYPGEQGGNAVADVLFGDYNPAGRLPLTFYKSTTALPPFNDYEVSNSRTYMYDNDNTLYPFGHGLSYTNFSYTWLRISRINRNYREKVELKLTVDIKNTGTTAGDEVVQVYARRYKVSGKDPLKQLAGFRRVHFTPGETKTIEIPISMSVLRTWDGTQHVWKPFSDFQLLIGSSSDDIRLVYDVHLGRM